ncbi:MAG: DUF885 family protein, partial [Gemmatimonadaceae bacterium]|nr:DUF885 family protein [Gemmatimonadaceae bacterium]
TARFCRLPLLALVVTGCRAPEQPDAAQALAALETQFFDQFQRRHPSIAAGNALHAGDGALEDFSATAIEQEVAELRAMREGLRALDSTSLTPDQRVDRRILDGVIGGWVLDLTVVKTWQRNPMIYASAIADGVHNLMVMEHAPATERLRLVTSKLRGVPKLLTDAQANIPLAPRIFASRAVAFLRGADDLLARDLWRAFSAVTDSTALTDARRAADAARVAIARYVAYLEGGIATGIDADWRVGADDWPNASMPRSPPSRCGSPCDGGTPRAARWCRRCAASSPN